MNALRGRFSGLKHVEPSNVSALLIFEVLYKWLGSVTIFPLIYLFIIRCIRGVEGNFHQIYFTRFGNYAFLALLLLIAAFYFLFEISVLLKGFSYMRRHRRAGILKLIKEGFLTTLKYALPVNWVAVIIVLCFIPVLHYGTRLAIPQLFYLIDLSINTGRAFMEVTTLIIMLAAIVLFSGAYVIFTECDLNFLASFVVSLELFKKEPLKKVFGIIAVLIKILIVAVLSFALIALVSFLVFFIIRLTGENYLRYFTDYVAALFSLYGLLFSVFSTFYFFFSIYEMLYGRIEILNFRGFRPLMVLFIVLCIIFAVVQGASVSGHISDGTLRSIERGSLLTGHRGNMKMETDNTSASFESAFNNGADAVELDVTRTADGVTVVSHDDNLLRQTGQNIMISDSTYETIRGLDLRDQDRRTSPGQKILTLTEAIEEIKPRGSAVIELKEVSNADALIKDVVDTVDAAGISEESYITSTNYQYLKRVETIDSNLKTYLIVWDEIPDLDELVTDGICIEEHNVTPELVRAAHLRNKEVIVWPIENEEMAKEMLLMGVDNMITNDVGLTNTVLLNSAPSALDQIFGVFASVLRET